MEKQIDIPAALKPADQEKLKDLQKRVEKLTLELVDFFRKNQVAKEDAAIAMTMLLDHMEAEGVAVIRINKTMTPEQVEEMKNGRA